MRRLKRLLAILVLAGGLTVQPGCATPGAGPNLMTLLLGTGLSVGGYFLAQELSD